VGAKSLEEKKFVARQHGLPKRQKTQRYVSKKTITKTLTAQT